MNEVLEPVTRERYEIPAQNIGKLTEKIERLAKKARKLHCGELGMVTIETKKIEYQDEMGWQRYRTVYVVEVYGPAPRLNGWCFIATLEHSPDGTIVRGVPGVTTEGELTRYREASPLCQHCGLRRNRIDTYILRHDDGTYKQVGTNCLADFLNTTSPESLAQMAEYLADAANLARGMGGFGGETGALATEDYLQCVTALIRRLGFVPRSKAQEWEKIPTADRVNSMLEDNHKHADCHAQVDGATCSWTKKHNSYLETCSWNEVGGHVYVTTDDRARADAALTWIREMPSEGLNDYMYNLWVACRSESVEPRRYGIVASLPSAYAREVERHTRRAEETKNWKNEHVGTVGERLEPLVLTVHKVTPFEGNYGVTLMHIFNDAEGRTYKWWSSGGSYEENSTVTVSATVKSHEIYQKRYSTVLTRVSDYISPEEKKALATLRREARKNGQSRSVSEKE